MHLKFIFSNVHVLQLWADAESVGERETKRKIEENYPRRWWNEKREFVVDCVLYDFSRGRTKVYASKKEYRQRNDNKNIHDIEILLKGGLHGCTLLPGQTHTHTRHMQKRKKFSYSVSVLNKKRGNLVVRQTRKRKKKGMHTKSLNSITLHKICVCEHVLRISRRPLAS